MTPLEKRLKETPPRPIPSEWRTEILAAAKAQSPSWPLASSLLLIRDPHSALRNLLWPHPYAWGALAACWIVIALLSFSGPRGEALYAVTPAGMKPVEISTEYYAAYLRARDILLADNFDPAPVVWIERRKL